jgi:H+-translocating NAD(P) transhydrogenase subunit alpha
VFGTINVVGGFLVTDRMLHMFRRRPEPKQEKEEQGQPPLEEAA